MTMQITSEIVDVAKNEEFIDVIIKATNNGTTIRSVSTISCYVQKREGVAVYAIENFAELLSDDPPGGDPDADFGRLIVVGNRAEFAEAGSARGFKQIAPGESVACKFRVAISSGGGAVPHNSNEHYVNGHLTETNYNFTTPMETTVLTERINIVAA